MRKDRPNIEVIVMKSRVTGLLLSQTYLCFVYVNCSKGATFSQLNFEYLISIFLYSSTLSELYCYSHCINHHCTDISESCEDSPIIGIYQPIRLIDC